MNRLAPLLLVIFALYPGVAAARDWYEAETDHFVIVSSGSERDLRKFATRLESFHWLLDQVTGLEDTAPSSMKVRVILTDGLDGVRRLAGESSLSSVAGFYLTGERGSIAVAPENTRDGRFTNQLVLFHEYAHHHMLQYMPAAYPSWYVEGYAEVAATASFENEGEITFGKAAQHRTYELGANLYNSVADLIDGSYLDDPKTRFRWTYGDAWLIAHYLTFSEDRRGQLRDYLEAINRGNSLKEASSAFGDLIELQREIIIYGRSRGVPYRSVPLPQNERPSVSIRRIDEVDTELLRHELNFSRLSRLPQIDDLDDTGEPDKQQEEFEKRLADAIEERDAWLTELAAFASHHPRHAGAWELLAASRCAAELFRECRDAATQSLASDASNPRSTAHKAMADLHLIGEVEPARREDVAVGAINSLVAAFENAPQDPAVLLSYYRSFGLVGLEPPESAISALVTALYLLPQEPVVRLSLAQEFLRLERYRDARTILSPLTQSLHERAAAKVALELLAQIEQIETEAEN